MKHQYAYQVFGKDPLFPLTQDQVAMVRQLSRLFYEQRESLDDLTWENLDLDTVYVRMNGTMSGAGDLKLYAMLRQPTIREDQLLHRRQIIEWALQEEAERESVLNILSACGKRYKDDLEQPFYESHDDPKRVYVTYFIWTVILASALMMLWNPIWFGLALITLCFSTFRYFYLHKKLEQVMDPIVYLVDHIQALHKLAGLELTGLQEVQQSIQALSRKLHQMKKVASFGYFEDSVGLLNFITHKESRCYDAYASMIQAHKTQIMEAFSLLGELDACISAASFALRTGANRSPMLQEHSCDLDAKQMVHPLVEACVANDVDCTQNLILTGSNATGKSTYLKMIALNAVLAQAFHMCYANSYTAGYFRIATAMNVKDHMERGESTFIAEGRAMKYLFDLGTDELPALCIIDEVLRGTNTLDRISASAVLLKEFLNRPARCIVATHDMELTGLLGQYYRCAHFSERMEEGKMIFDYRLHPGVTTTRNAIDLLAVFHYPPDLVQNARDRLQFFERHGVWEQL